MLPNDYSADQNNQDPGLKNEFEAPTPLPQQPMPSQYPNNKPVKSKKMLAIIIGVAIVLLLTAGGVGAYLALNNGNDDETNNNTKLSLKDFGETLKASVSQSKNVSLLTYEAPYLVTMNHKVSDKVWVLPEANSTVLSVSSNREKSEDNKKDYDALTKKLVSSGFTEISTAAGKSKYSTKTATINYFTSKDIVCNLKNTPSDPTYSVQVDCVEKADFKANADAVAPLANSYSTKDDVIFGNVVVQDSSTENYKNARVTIFKLDDLTSGSVASFYQASDKQWNFFSETKDPDQTSCADYNTDDLKKAFEGFTCLDTTTDKSSFVQKSAPTFEIVPGSQG